MRFHRRTDPELPDHHRRDRSAWDLASRRHDHESSEAPRCWPHQMSASPSDPQSAPQPSWRSACGAATLPRTTKEGRGHWPLPSSHFTLSDACDSHTPSHALPDFHPDLGSRGVSPQGFRPPWVCRLGARRAPRPSPSARPPVPSDAVVSGSPVPVRDPGGEAETREILSNFHQKSPFGFKRWGRDIDKAPSPGWI